MSNDIHTLLTGENFFRSLESIQENFCLNKNQKISKPISSCFTSFKHPDRNLWASYLLELIFDNNDFNQNIGLDRMFFTWYLLSKRPTLIMVNVKTGAWSIK